MWACGQRASVVQAQRHVHSQLAESTVDAFAPDRHRRAVGEPLVRTPAIVKGDPRADAGVRVTAVDVALEVDVLMLERAPQPFDEDVVHPAAAAIHRDAHTGGYQHAGEGCAGELAALIGVEDLRLAEARQSFLQGRDAKRGIHGVGQPPSQHRSARPVHDRNQIKEAAADRNVRDVRAPRPGSVARSSGHAAGRERSCGPARVWWSWASARAPQCPSGASAGGRACD
jgi:hypothetical protein